MIRYWLLAALAMSTFLIAGCNKNEEWSLPKTADQRQQAAPDAMNQQGNPSNAERNDYLQATRQEIDRLRSQIDALAVKAKNASAELRASLEKKIPALQDSLKDTEKKWQEVKSASATAWKEMKSSLTGSIEKLKQAIHNADNP